MKKDIAICTVAFGELYIMQQGRLLRSIPPGYDVLAWTNDYPPGSRTFENSLYGFKVHAVTHARNKGFKKIIWLDTACIVHDHLDYLFHSDMPPVVAVRDESKLIDTISDKALAYYGKPFDKSWHLVGGSMYAFSFNEPDCEFIFNHWAKAEADGIFGSAHEQASEQINKHRHDESCMAMALYCNGYEPVTPEQARYCIGDKSIVIKKHFK